jgi:hypothetical protein
MALACGEALATALPRVRVNAARTCLVNLPYSWPPPA